MAFSLAQLTKSSRPIFTAVPGEAPIELVAYYPEFLEYYLKCELQTKRWFVENAQPDWVMLDVGANIGYYSILFSRLAYGGRIYAFEPTSTVDLLRCNLIHHQITNVEILQLALGATSGQIEENIYRIWGHAPERMKYDFSTVDDVINSLRLQKLDCIKIDVDSFDFDVLRGATRTLQRFNPWIVVELNHALSLRNQSVSAALEWLVGRGYRRAFVTDNENFILRRQSEEGVSDASVMSLSFDRRPLFMPPKTTKDDKLCAFSLNMFCAHNNNKVRYVDGSGCLSATVAGPIWSYAVSWPIPIDAKPLSEALIEVGVLVRDGEIGIGCVSSDYSSYCSEEIFVQPSASVQIVTLFLKDAEVTEHLIVRNADATNTTAHVQVNFIHVFTTKPKPYKASALLSPKRTRLSLGECEGVLHGGDFEQRDPVSGADAIDVVPIAELHCAFGFPRVFIPEIKVYPHTLAEFSSETDEAAIFQYIYEQARPKRHLEFGTWEGFGVTLCARASEAEIWTINLPDGEIDSAGRPVYGRNNFDGTYDDAMLVHAEGGATDEGDAIGWRYRAAGYNSRVHQILCDSRDLDTSQFSPGFFDTVLIDGGHTPEVVRSDTEKALSLLRGGGILIWHDFCPEPETIARNQAPRGVVRAIVDNFRAWRPSFSKMFWIQPSWILIGIKV